MSLEAEFKSRDDLRYVKAWIQEGEHDRAARALQLWLQGAPDDSYAVFLLGMLALSTNQAALGRIILEWLIANGKDDARNPHVYAALGKALNRLHRNHEAIAAFERVCELDPETPHGPLGLETAYVQLQKPEKAIEVATPLFDHPDPEVRATARSSAGFAYLQLGDYARGWDFFEHGLGRLINRGEPQYQGEERWDGRTGKDVHVVVHSEQGVGDQIAAIEPLRDMMQDVTVSALHVDEQLQTLFARSFPDIPVHGDPNERPCRIDYRTSLFSIHRYYRRSADAYPGTPYLVPDPARRTQWRALLDSLGPRCNIGIAWSGGIRETHADQRRIPLDDLAPIFALPANFISLEYRDRSDEIAAYREKTGTVIHDWPWGTRASDLEHLAALVAELDCVVCVPTTSLHMAGAVGCPAWGMVHSSPNIHYPAESDRMPYYGSVRLVWKHDRSWRETARQVAAMVREEIAIDAAA